MRKSAITVLARTHDDLNGYGPLVMRNKAIYEKMHDPDRYDIIIFHEDTMTESHRSFIQSHTPNLPIKFVNVMDEFDPSFARFKGRWSTYYAPYGERFPIGYRHMCRFWLHGFLKYVKDYAYTIRIDDDCIVQSLPSKLTEEMATSGCRYVTGSIDFNFHDEPVVLSGLQECANEFGRLHGVAPPLNTTTAPYTNFFVLDNDYFNNSVLFKEWCDFVDAEGGIYVSRWGDISTFGIFLKNFMNDSEYRADGRIQYFHGSHNSQVGNETVFFY